MLWTPQTSLVFFMAPLEPSSEEKELELGPSDREGMPAVKTDVVPGPTSIGGGGQPDGEDHTGEDWLLIGSGTDEEQLSTPLGQGEWSVGKLREGLQGYSGGSRPTSPHKEHLEGVT